MRFSRRMLATGAAAIPFLIPLPGPNQLASAWLSEEFAAASSRITTLGRHLPGGELDGQLSLIWVDVERQLFHAARGQDDEEKLRAFTQTQFGNMPQFYTRFGAIEDDIGFGYLNIRQAISSHPLPETVQLLHLDIDVAGLPSIWQEAGFEEREGDYGSFWTIGEDGEYDLQHPVQREMMAGFNNIALLDDRTLAFAPTSDLLAEVMATTAGDTPNVLSALEPVTTALPKTAIGAMCISGEIFAVQEAAIPEALAESDNTVGAMPVVRTSCTGTTQGASVIEDEHDGNAVAFIILETEGEAEQAADVIAWRHGNMMSPVSGQPYREILGEIETEIVSDTVLRVTSKIGASRAAFSQMMMKADTLLFAYQRG